MVVTQSLHTETPDGVVVPAVELDTEAPRPVLRRRHGIRMSCGRCEVAWTGSAESNCWFCEGPGVPGPPPSIYPDIT